MRDRDAQDTLRDRACRIDRKENTAQALMIAATGPLEIAGESDHGIPTVQSLGHDRRYDVLYLRDDVSLRADEQHTGRREHKIGDRAMDHTVPPLRAYTSLLRQT